MMPRGANDLVRLMNSENELPFQHINALYWSIAPSALHGVLDYIRTALAQLVAELRASMDQKEEIPSTEAADQAVNVVVTGKRSQVKVVAAQSSGEQGTAAATANEESAAQDSLFWTRSRRIGAFIAGLATVVGAVAAVIQMS